MSIRSTTWWGLVLLSGCVSIQTETRVAETLVRRETSTHTVEGTLTYYSDVELDGESVRVRFSSDEQCERVVRPIYRRFAHHHRTIDDEPTNRYFRPLNMVVLGVVAAGAGVFTYTDADSLAADAAMMGDTSNTAASYREGGLVAVGLGGLALTIALIDGVRLADSDDELKPIPHDAETTRESCHDGVPKNAEVVLAAGDWSTRGSTDRSGVIRFELSDLPEAAFKSNHVNVTATIEGADAPVKLSDEQTSQLFETLIADSNSRISRERDAAQTASCNQQIEIAKGFTVTPSTGEYELRSMESKWEKAESTCASKWLPEYAEARDRFRGAAEAARREYARAACQQAVQRQFDALSADEAMLPSNQALDTTVAALEQQCATIDDRAAIVGRVADRVAAIERQRLTQAEAAEAERARAEYAAELEREQERKAEEFVNAVAPLYQAKDAVGLVRVLQNNKELRAWFVKLKVQTLPAEFASYWLNAVLAGQKGAGTQLCASKSLAGIVGAGAGMWSSVRSDAIKNHSDAVAQTRIAKAMNACP